MESLKTIFQATLFSLFAGGGLGLIGGIAVYYLARLEAKSMNPWQAASYISTFAVNRNQSLQYFQGVLLGTHSPTPANGGQSVL
jgi:hypothetical protein